MMLLASIGTMNLFIMLIAEQYKPIVSNWLVNVCSGAIVLISAIILYRQKFKGLYGRTYGAIAIGLMLWFTAEIVNTFDYGLEGQVRAAGAAVNPSFLPSIADAFWLAGYAFFAYFLFRIMVQFSKSIKLPFLIGMAVATGIVIVVLTQSIGHYAMQQQQSANSDVIALFLKIEYPILDTILIVPAMVTLSGLRGGKLTATPWILFSCAVLILAVGDIGNVYSSVLYGVKNHWIWNMFATAGYLCIATSLFWYNRFFIFDAKRTMKAWQESNK